MTDWTHTLTRELKTLISKGLTAQKICDRMNEKFGMDLTRNAIIGRSHRIKAKLKQKPGSVKKEKPQFVIVPVPEVIEPVPEVIELPVFIQGKSEIDIMELTDATCRWPSGDCAPYSYCGDHTDGKIYCEAHCKIAYQPSRR